jgi:N-acetylmuramoyl-L-alanine amidase
MKKVRDLFSYLHNKKLHKPRRDMSRFIWILDPGHGGIIDGEYVTPGKRSPVWEDGSQYFEGVGNREIVRKIIRRLSKENIRYLCTVDPTDNRDVPLKERVDFVNSLPYKQGNTVGISVHSDAFSDPKAHGWTVYTSVGETTSDKVATVFYNRAKEEFPEEKFRTDFSDGDADKESQFYILKNTVCPFILLENFFMTNERECREILMTEEGQNKIVNYIVRAVLHIEKNGV